MSYYDLLEVAPGASLEAIKSAYRRRAGALHPDRTAGLPEAERERSEEQMRAVNEAYAVLVAPARRALYDECLESGRAFAEAEAEARPETHAEKVAREHAEDEFREEVGRCLAALDQGLEDLDPRVHWHRREDEDPYWARVYEARRAPDEFTLYVRFASDLGTEDLPGVVRHAEALLQVPPAGLARRNHIYLMLGWVVWDAGQIYREIERFNRKSWAVKSGRQARGLIGCAGMQEGTPFLPGVDDPYPPLIELRIGVSARPDRRRSTGALVSTKPNPDSMAPLPQGRTLPERTVVVVDDDPLAVQIVRDTLTDAAFTVYYADDWAGFQELARTVKAAVVVLDVNLPTMPGEKLAIFARTFMKPPPKVIFHSAKPASELRRIARIYGAANFMQKGCEAERLVEAVEAAAGAWKTELASKI